MNADYVWKLSKFGRLTSTRLRFDDDFADRLNYQLTGLLLFVFVGIIGIRQYVGKPIHCWTPQEFTRSWEEYAENYCWVASTYFVRLNSYPGPPAPQMVYPQGTLSSGGYLVPVGHRFSAQAHMPPVPAYPQIGERPPAGRFISYYQWAPILLAIQSFLFYLPCLIWRLFSSRSGFHLRRIMQLSSEAALAAPTEADATSQPGQESGHTNMARLSIQNMLSFANHPGVPGTSSFAPTKSVRTLARYLDMCLMRQAEQRLADLILTLNDESRDAPIATPTPTTAPPPIPPPLVPRRQTRMVPPYPELNSQYFPLKQPEHVISPGRNSNEKFITPMLQPKHRPTDSQTSMLECETWDKSKGTNCLDLLCCCGMLSWCAKRTRFLCCGHRKSCTGRLCGCKIIKPTEVFSTAGLNSPDIRVKIGNCTGMHMAEHKESFRSMRTASTSGSQFGTKECPNYLCMDNGLTRRRSKCLCGRHQGNFLVRLYMFVKLLYVCNVVGQIYLLEYYTGVQYNFYGVRVLYDLATGRQWEESGHFPRVTFCDFEARKLAQSHYYTLQCVLPINMFLEKIYIFLWLWLFVVGIVTLLSMIVWITRIGTSRCRFSWVRHQLLTIRQLNKSDRSCMQFVDNHLGPDGVFVLRLIAQNYGDLVAGDTVGELWSAYWQRRQGGNVNVSGDVRTNDKTPDIAEFGKQYSTQAVQNIAQPRVKKPGRSDRNTPTNRTERTQTPLSGDPLHRTGSQKDKRRKHLMQTGYSATMMATEMIHPSERFAVPLLTSRKPPSVNSNDSSRYSRESRDRDRSDSPPPIPQRSSDGGDYSFSEQRSIPDLDVRSNSPVSLNEPRDSIPRDGDAEERDLGHVVAQDEFSHPEVNDRGYEEQFDASANGFDQHEYGQYRDDYVEGFNHDDHIV
uniref:Innexin n=1 Tax=Cryptocotyle lingua TaxID=66766 RepID=A0A7U0TJ77_9TREM|nr:innexin 5 [Cryptocotyle lingua]